MLGVDRASTFRYGLVDKGVGKSTQVKVRIELCPHIGVELHPRVVVVSLEG
jgi:hypothetical protein